MSLLGCLVGLVVVMVLASLTSSHGGNGTAVMVVALLAFIPSAIAQRKGHSWGAWWWYGFLLFIVALPASLIVKPNRAAVEQRAIDEDAMKRCPFCAELIRREGVLCRYCGSTQPSTTPTGTPTITRSAPQGRQIPPNHHW